MEGECPSGFQVHDQLEFDGRLDRKIPDDSTAGYIRRLLRYGLFDPAEVGSEPDSTILGT